MIFCSQRLIGYNDRVSKFGVWQRICPGFLQGEAKTKFWNTIGMTPFFIFESFFGEWVNVSMPREPIPTEYSK